MEDDEGVRALARRVLLKHGYTVREARNGEEALNLYRQHAHSVELIVSDMVMPEMTGRELAQAIRALDPELAMLFMSGYTEDAVMRQSFLEPGTAFIEKPFTPAAFARKVREVLDRVPALVNGR